MALDTTTLKDALKAAFAANLPGITTAQDAALETTCQAIADALKDFVTGADINYISGLTAGGDPVTGVFTGNLS